MKNSLFFIINILFGFSVYSQVSNPYTIKMSQTINEEGTYNAESSETYMLGEDQFINIKLSNKNLATKLNSNLNKICSKSFENNIKSDKGKFEIIGSTLIGNEPHIIGWMEDDDMATYGAFKITSNCTLDVKGKYTEAINIKDKSAKMKMKVYDGPTFMESKKPHFFITKSNNKKFTLIVCTRGNITIDEQKVLITVLDENFDRVFYAEKTFPINYENFYFESLIVTDLGTPFALIKKQVKSLKSRFLVIGKNNTLSQTDFGKEEKQDNVSLFNIKDNTLKAISLKTNNKKIESISISNLDESGELNQKVTISQSDIKDKGFLENKDKLDMKRIELLPNSKGEVYVCVEHYDYFSETSMESNMTTGRSGLSSTPPRRVNGDILVLNVNGETNVFNWSGGVDKFQDFGSSSKGNYGGTYFSVIDNNLGAFYNDNESNHDSKNTKYDRNINTLLKSCLALRVLSNEGNKLYKVVGGKEMASNLKPLSFSNIDNNSILFYGNEIVALGKTTNKSNYGLFKYNGVENTKTSEISKKSENSASKSLTKNSSPTPSNSASSPSNTSAIAHGEARTPSAAVAKNYKYKADEKSVEYYNELRKKFEEEEKVRKEKEALLAIEKAKKEEEAKQGRRLSEDQAPQFEKFRQGEKNPVVKKTTAEEDYKSLFK